MNQYKKIALISALGFVLLLAAAPAMMPAMAQDFQLRPKCDATKPPGEAGACNVQAFVDWVKTIINYLFIISVPIATVFIVYGAFVMMKSGGNPGEFAKGKTIVVSAIIGIVIIFTANLIVTTVVNALKGI